MSLLLIVVLALTLVAEFVNGWTDAPNAIATVVSTRVMPIKVAVLMAVGMNVLGAISGTAVAATIGTGFVDPKFVTLPIIASALIALVIWGTITAYFGIPTSKTHELVAGLTGAAFAIAGPTHLVMSGWIKIGIGLAASSVLGITIAFVIGKAIYFWGLHTDWAPSRARRTFDRLQIMSAGLVAYNHGMNDGQKFIGIFTIALVSGHVLPTFDVPLWVALLCASVMGIGTACGGKKIISMLGEKMTTIASWQGFSAETSSSVILFISSLTGIPISTTHTVSTSVMGAAAAKNTASVRWYFAKNIVLAWIVTFPVCAAIGYAAALLLSHFISFA